MGSLGPWSGQPGSRRRQLVNYGAAALGVGARLAYDGGRRFVAQQLANAFSAGVDAAHDTGVRYFRGAPAPPPPPPSRKRGRSDDSGPKRSNKRVRVSDRYQGSRRPMARRRFRLKRRRPSFRKRSRRFVKKRMVKRFYKPGQRLAYRYARRRGKVSDFTNICRAIPSQAVANLQSVYEQKHNLHYNATQVNEVETWYYPTNDLVDYLGPNKNRGVPGLQTLSEFYARHTVSNYALSIRLWHRCVLNQSESAAIPDLYFAWRILDYTPRDLSATASSEMYKYVVQGQMRGWRWKRIQVAFDRVKCNKFRISIPIRKFFGTRLDQINPLALSCKTPTPDAQALGKEWTGPTAATFIQFALFTGDQSTYEVTGDSTANAYFQISAKLDMTANFAVTSSMPRATLPDEGQVVDDQAANYTDVVAESTLFDLPGGAGHNIGVSATTE